MAMQAAIGRCVKCRTKCVTHCRWCDDFICYYHSEIDDKGKRSCFPCVSKLYIQWRAEQEEAEGEKTAYHDWMVKQAQAEGVKLNSFTNKVE